MKHYGKPMRALLAAAGVAAAVGLSGTGILPAGTAVAAPISAGGAAPAPAVTPASPQTCIIGLNCGCIRHRTCPGDRRRSPAARPPEVQIDGGGPAIANNQQVGPGLTPAPVLASP